MTTLPHQARILLSLSATSLAILVLAAGCSAGAEGDADDEMVRPETLMDLSGLAWVDDDTFLGVHDAKDNPKKHDWPRVTLMQLPDSELDGVPWESLDVEFPGEEGRSSDLESVSKIPGDRGFLFAESGQEGKDDRRVFHAVFDDAGNLTIDGYAHWPVPIDNVEATEVGQIGDQLVFMYAERASDQPSTQLRWAVLSLTPPSIGEFREVTFDAIDPAGDGARPIVAMDLDSDGQIYIASAYDSGDDDGPFRSAVYMIGRLTADDDGLPAVVLDDAELIGMLDGIKVESVAIREHDGESQIFVGSDDEHYGGILRLLP